MTVEQLEQRVLSLEKQIQELRSKVESEPALMNQMAFEKWLQSRADRFNNDPGFDEVVRLGREYRDAQVFDEGKPLS